MEWTRANFLGRDGAALTYEIHDKYFDVDMMDYDNAQHLWSLPIGDKKEGPYDGRIVVAGVIDCRIKDTARIGIYSIYSMRFNDASGVLRLKCNQTLGVWLTVAPDFRVTVVDRSCAPGAP